MLDFNHILTVLSSDWKSITAGVFLSGGIFIWMAHVVTKMTKSDGGKMFWLAFAILLLKDILESKTILMNSMTYVAIGILFTHFNLVTQPIKNIVQNLKQRSYNKYRKCKAKNQFIENQEAKEKRENENMILNRNKKKQEEMFLNKLSKKLDSF